jgi:predicted transcriptional regulator
MSAPPKLTRREREIMDIIHRREQATAAEVLGDLADPPSYSAVRALLRLLEERGHITHTSDGPRYVYRALASREEASRSALMHVVSTFFDGSVGEAIANLVDPNHTKLSAQEISRIQKIINQAKRKDS